MKSYSTILLFLLMLSQVAFGQKAELFNLEKLYAPQPASGDWVAWKNDEVIIPIRFQSKSQQPVKVTFSDPEAEVKLYQLHDVLADFSAGNCGETKTDGTFEQIQIPDRAELRNDLTFVPLGETQWVLMVVKFPQTKSSGTFAYTVGFDQQGKKTQVKGNFTLRDRVLSSLENLDFYSDFWQFPISVADYYKLKPWTEEHWQEVGVMFDQLAGINQQSITTSVFWDLYNTRIRPIDEMMIQVRKKADGSFSYDYAVFDKYVAMAQSKGIKGQIAVHNLFPWNGFLFYLDETSGEVQSVQTQPGTPEYQAFWKPFLVDFSDHLVKKGWQQQTVFFIDERDPNLTLDLAKWVKSIAPSLKMGFSGDFYPFLSEWMDDYSMPVNVVVDPAEMKKRILSSQKTSLYTSCFEQPNQPNLLLPSDYRDLYFLTLLAKSRGYNGMLRWAFNLWSSDIMNSAIYSDLPSGDAHLVYPEGQVSVRYLVLRDALEEVSKFETVSKVSNSVDMINATNRYFLINIEAERNQMFQALKSYLND